METNENNEGKPENNAQDDGIEFTIGNTEHKNQSQDGIDIISVKNAPKSDEKDETESIDEMSKFLGAFDSIPNAEELQEATAVSKIIRYNKELQLDNAAAANPALKPVVEAHRELLVDKLRFVERNSQAVSTYLGWSILDLTPSQFFDVVYTGKDNIRQFVTKAGLEEKVPDYLRYLEDMKFDSKAIAATIFSKLEAEAAPVRDAFAQEGKKPAAFIVKTVGDLAELYASALHSLADRQDASAFTDYLRATGLYDKKIDLKFEFEEVGSDGDADIEFKINDKGYISKATWTDRDATLEEVASFDSLMKYQLDKSANPMADEIDINKVAKQAEQFAAAAKAADASILECLYEAGQKEGLFVSPNDSRQAISKENIAALKDSMRE